VDTLRETAEPLRTPIETRALGNTVEGQMPIPPLD